MKKQLCLLLSVICLFTASCKPSTAGQTAPATATGALFNQEPSAGGAVPPSTAAATQAPPPEPASRDESVDVDLTALSITMVYAEVYNMMVEPDSYTGKTIRGRGIYENYYYEEMDRTFHFFIILDATGCCPQGMDFVWNGEHEYPGGYPEIGDEIEVTGVFIKGEIEGVSYYYIDAETLTVLQ